MTDQAIIEPYIGDTVRVELHDGTEIEGIFDIHPLADECVMLNGLPRQYKRVIEITHYGKFSPKA